MVTFGEVLKFDPEQLQEIFRICTSAHGTCTTFGNSLKGLDTLHTWQGAASDAARTAVGRTRVDIDSHGQEVAQVGRAAANCYDEGVALKKAALDCQRTADGEHFTIDPDTGKVSDPNPPDTAGWTAAKVDEYRRRITDLQQRVDNVVLDGARFDQDLATLINGADGQLPLNSSKGDNEIDRRANQIAAFRNVYHRDPATENEWRMADALDPHTYDPKYRGVESNVVVAKFNPVPGGGVYRQNLYIPSPEVQNMDTNPADWVDGRMTPHDVGDNRGPSATVPAEASRVSVFADLDNGVLVARQNPSMSTDGKDAGAGSPRVSAVQGVDGAMEIHYSAADPFAPSLSKPVAQVAGTMMLTPLSGGNLGVDGMVTSYPSAEGYQYKPDGSTVQLFNQEATMSQAGPMTNLPFGERNHVGNYSGVNSLIYPAEPTDGSPLRLVPEQHPTLLGSADAPPKISVAPPYVPDPPPSPPGPPQAATTGVVPTPPPLPAH
ncbi:hypothetical protein [Nocardia heshunensis]